MIQGERVHRPVGKQVGVSWERMELAQATLGQRIVRKSRESQLAILCLIGTLRKRI